MVFNLLEQYDLEQLQFPLEFYTVLWLDCLTQMSHKGILRMYVYITVNMRKEIKPIL